MRATNHDYAGGIKIDMAEPHDSKSELTERQEVAEGTRPRFTRIILQGGVQLSACTRCRAVVAFADTPEGLQAEEDAHRCRNGAEPPNSASRPS